MYRKPGIICASDAELEPFIRQIKDVKITEKAMLKFYEGKLDQVSVIVLYSGVCKVNAAIAAQLLIDLFQVDLIINAGAAGGMDESVRLLDTVISEQIVYHDVTDDVLTEFHPWMQSCYFMADKELLAAAKEYCKTAEYPIRFGTMATGEQFIEDEKRDEINRKFAPLSVDMETAAIAHVCYVNQVPFLAVRSITDTASHKGKENFERNCEMASEISSKITIGLLGSLCAVKST